MQQRLDNSADNLSILGSGETNYPQHPDEAVLEAIPNQWRQSDYIVNLDCHEFTCVCPKTGQPDFAKIFISYIPGDFLIESKALKLYLFSFRNIGIFHEFVVNKIADDLQKILGAKFIRVYGDFMPRGGIAIRPDVKLGNIALYNALLGEV
jgi:7-cyano-7-deazaguanine reductase